MATKTTQVIIVSQAFLLSLFHLCSGHSFILVPKGDFMNFNKPECRQGGPPHAPNDNCKGPCIGKDSWQYNSNEKITTYKRGEIVEMVWARNNHRGGFVRFTLVPEKERMNETAHNIFAFRYACYDSDKHECTYDTSKERRCGTDKYIQRTKVEIPSCLEDGYYILGWSWYGGIDWRQKSLFADYWSCSRIRIEGGLLTTSYKPIFNPGENVKLDDPKKPTCMASTDKLRDCEIEPCLGRPVYPRVPAKFADGKEPTPILRSWTTTKPKSSSPAKTPSPKVEGPRSLLSPIPKAYVSSLRLIDVDTDETLAKTFFRIIYIPRRVVGLSFIANVRGEAESVSFYINDKFIRKEKELPYTAFGDLMGEVYRWPKPIYEKWVKIRVLVVARSGKKHQKMFDMFLKKKGRR